MPFITTSASFTAPTVPRVEEECDVAMDLGVKSDSLSFSSPSIPSTSTNSHSHSNDSSRSQADSLVSEDPLFDTLHPSASFESPPSSPEVLADSPADSSFPETSFAEAQAQMAAQNSSHSQNLVGHRIDNGRLEFISVLGLGAYGVVYLAQDIQARPNPGPTSRAHPELGCQPLYAVKCLNKLGLDERQRNFQRREISLHSLASHHPNVVTLHNVIEEESCIYVVLDFCEEGDLFGMITETQRYLGDDELIRRVFLQIVGAVDYCHSMGIYHRDLKPENILCSKDGQRVVLADFGLATSERTSADFGCGSTFYMSPECQGGLFQRLGAYSTAQNDIWSLGVILVNLTCGRNPWKQACPSDETFRAYLSNPDFLRSILPISRHTNSILKRIFALNPLARISTKDLIREIKSVKTFTMTEEELRTATRATREAAKAFVAVPKPVEVAVEPTQETIVDEETDDGSCLDSPIISPWTSQAEPATPQVDKVNVVVKPLPTPPSTPRRSDKASTVRPVLVTPPSFRNVRTREASFSSSDEAGDSDSSPSCSPEQPSVSSFADARLPPTPITPTHPEPTRAPVRKSSRSPRIRQGRPQKGSGHRRRKESVDSSSGSSGASQPPTPGSATFPHAVLGCRFADQVKIVSNNPHDASLLMSVDESAAESIASQASSKASYTAYYPIFSDWADAADCQQSLFNINVPPPAFIPANVSTGRSTYTKDSEPPTKRAHERAAHHRDLPEPPTARTKSSSSLFHYHHQAHAAQQQAQMREYARGVATAKARG